MFWIIRAGVRSASRAGNQPGRKQAQSGEGQFWFVVFILVIVAGAAVEYPVFRWFLAVCGGLVAVMVIGGIVYGIAHRNDNTATARKRAEDAAIRSVLSDKPPKPRGVTRQDIYGEN